MAGPSPFSSRDRDTVHYTAYIRLPFPRADFVDPPLVDWNLAKDDALWRELSDHNEDRDWQKLADHFHVTLPFLLQQVAWLYKKQHARLMEQMQRISMPSPAPPSEEKPAHGEEKLTLHQTIEPLETGPTTPRGAFSRSRGNSWQGKNAPISRTASTNTITQSRAGIAQSPNTLIGSSRTHVSPRQLRSTDKAPNVSERRSNLDDSEDSGSDSSADDMTQSRLSKSQVFRRAPQFTGGNNRLSENEEDEGGADLDEEATFFTRIQDPTATTEIDGEAIGEIREPITVTRISSTANTDSSESSLANSRAFTSNKREATRTKQRTGPLSPHQRAGINPASPRGRALGLGKEGSDGTPSMGSSFSDLDGEETP